MTTTGKPNFIAYAVTGDGKEAYWTRIGSAWQHQHGEGFNIDLNALPVNGRIVLMPGLSCSLKPCCALSNVGWVARVKQKAFTRFM